MDVKDALISRRSVKHFDAEFVMPDADFKALIEHSMLSPTSYNVQHWRFVRVSDKEKRQAIKDVAWNQAQVTDASELLILCGDLKSWEKSPEQYWRNAPKEKSDVIVPMIGDFYKDRAWIQRDEVMRSVGIAAQSIMLLAKEMGYDSCPMIGFDQDAVAKIINLPDDHVIGMMITVGKAISPAHKRGGSIAYDDAVIENSFK